ncbi:MAG: MMPL family transporter [Thermodesulfobacteriota bacterium]
METLPQPTRFESLMNRLAESFEHLGGFVYDHKKLVVALTLVIVGVSAYFAEKVRFDTSFESYFDRDDPAYAAYLDYRDDFGSDEMAYILYEVPDNANGVWDLEVMKKIERLTRELEAEVPFIKEVTSLANAEFIEGREDELLVREILDPYPQTREELLAMRDKVMKKPLLAGTLTSADGKYGAVYIEMEKSSVDAEETLVLDPAKGPEMDNVYPQVTNDAIERVLARPEYAGIRFHHTGDAALTSTYNRITRGESLRLGLLAVAFIGGLLLLFFRRPMGVLGPLLTVSLAILAAMGFVGIVGWHLDIMFMMLPGTIITVGVASAIHILTGYTVCRKQLKDNRAAIRKTMLLVGAPCLFTMLTDVAGFGSTNISPIKAINHFAYYSSFGVIMAFAFTVTVFIAILTLFGNPAAAGRQTAESPAAADARPRKKHFSVRFFAALTRFDVRHPWKIIIVWMVFFAVTGSGTAFLQVDSNFLNEFSEDLPIRKTTEYVDRTMLGAGGFSYVFDSGEQDGICDPEFLKRVETLQNRINQETQLVMKTMSIVDLLKDINRSFHDEDPAYYVLPETRELAAQYLLLYEMSGGDELGNYVTGDMRRVNLQVHSKLVSSSVYKKVTDDVNDFITKEFPPEQQPVLTGSGYLWIKLVQYIVRSQILGFSVAFGVIAVMMCLALGSIRVGLLSMIPNLAPVFVTLGFMGLTGIPLDYVKLLIASIAIGIAVDDTLHFLLRYRLEFWRTRDYQAALNASLNDVGRAVFITTLVLLAGFATNLFSVMNSFVEFGYLTLITLSVAALADYFLTPALIIVTRAFGPEAR